MTFWFRSRIRHPFFPGLPPTPAGEAKGRALALSGAYDDLESAAAKGVSAQRAVFVLLGWRGPPFTLEQRDRLWKLFQTPVYAILLGRDGRVAGFECEVQNGFHAPGKAKQDPEMLCECGRPGRVLQLDADNALKHVAGLASGSSNPG